MSPNDPKRIHRVSEAPGLSASGHCPRDNHARLSNPREGRSRQYNSDEPNDAARQADFLGNRLVTNEAQLGRRRSQAVPLRARTDQLGIGSRRTIGGD